MVRPGVDGKKYKKIAFPTLLSHFSNYDYRSTNYQCIASLCVISKNFNFLSWMVQKWQDHVQKVSKNVNSLILFNSAQSFLQLWLPKCKSSIYQLNIHNLWKFQISISNGLEIKSLGMYKTWKSKQSWKKRVRVRKIDKYTVFGCT